MGDPYRQAQPGEPLRIPARVYNALLALLRERPASTDRDHGGASGAVLIRNDSGADQEQNAVLGIDGIVFSPTDNEGEFRQRPTLVGTAPAVDYRGSFVVLAEPIAAGAIGRAWVRGVCAVRIDVTDADHGCADVKDGDSSQLESAETGAAQILYRESGTGTKWAVVRLGNAPPRGDTPYTVYQVKSDGTSGFDWVRAH